MGAGSPAPSKIYSASALPPVIDGSYPVDPETAAAVEAASRHQVGSFPNEETVDWVFRHFVSQGKTPLPDDIDGGDEKVLRSWFRDSNSLEDFRSGRDFQYGLCDVCDRDVERACQSVYQSFRRLIDHGEIRSGAHVRFRGTLIRFFEDVPLLNQQWIDAYTVVLAEWSALLLQQGYQLGNADPHQLACVIPLKTNGAELLTPSTSADRTEAARRRVTAMLAKFEGRARTIEGRIYFHFDDYVRWKGRKAQCKAHYDGFVIASWNDWVEARGNGATAELDGIRVAKIAVRVPALVRCADSQEAARQQCRRADLIIGIVTQAYNNDRQIARWCEHFKKTIIEIYRIIFTIERIRRRYFGDHPPADEMERGNYGCSD